MIIKNKKAQHLTEYVLIVFVIIAATTAMVDYVKRALQAKIYSTRNNLVTSVESNVEKETGVILDVPAEYEMYYTKIDSVIDQESDVTEDLQPGKQMGTWRMKADAINRVKTQSVTAPPMKAD